MGEDVAHTGGRPADIAVDTAGTPLSPPGYELLDEIGHGGMGVVYRARDAALDRDVAVKLLSERDAGPIRYRPSASSLRHGSRASCSTPASRPSIRSAPSPMAGPSWR